MIGHKIEQHAHAVIFQRVGPCDEIGFRSQFRIEHAVIHDVVAVDTARMGFEDGRGVAVRHAERLQIGKDL